MIEHLSNRAVLEIKGKDKVNFLQGIVTNDMNKNIPLAYNLILSAQGKFLFDLFIYRKNERVFIDVEAAFKEAFLNKLKIYKLRSEVELIDISDDLKVYFSDEVMPNKDLCYLDTRLNKGYRILSASLSTQDNFYQQWRIQNIIPETGTELIYDKTFPLEYGMEYLNAIDFNKGCYVGQEVTARTKHRGVVRKFPFGIEADFSLNMSDIITNESDEKIGTITSSINSQAIGLLRIEEAKNAKQILIKNQPVRIKQVSWK